MAQLDFLVQSWALSLDGFGKAGTCEKVTLPKIKQQTELHRGGGMLAPRRHAYGYDEFMLEADITGYDPQALGLGALLFGKGKTFSLQAFLDGDQNATHSVYMRFRGFAEEIDAGQWDPGKKTALKLRCALDAMLVQVDGATLYDIDVEHSVYAVGGNDIQAAINAALGG